MELRLTAAGGRREIASSVARCVAYCAWKRVRVRVRIGVGVRARARVRG